MANGQSGLEDGSVDQFGHRCRHSRTGIELRLVPRHHAQVGFSETDRVAADRLDLGGSPWSDPWSQMSPSSPSQVEEFWVAEKPLSVSVARSIGIDCEGQLSGPAFLTLDEVGGVCDQMAWRMPMEVEWEAMSRGGGSTLFPWGDDLEPSSGLAVHMDWDLENPQRPGNAFGVHALFFGEWSRAASGEQREGHDVVIKGGGAQFWPWQGSGEWIWCIPSVRMSPEELPDGRAAFRPVVSW